MQTRCRCSLEWHHRAVPPRAERPPSASPSSAPLWRGTWSWTRAREDLIKGDRSGTSLGPYRYFKGTLTHHPSYLAYGHDVLLARAMQPGLGSADLASRPAHPTRSRHVRRCKRRRRPLPGTVGARARAMWHKSRGPLRSLSNRNGRILITFLNLAQERFDLFALTPSPPVRIGSVELLSILAGRFVGIPHGHLAKPHRCAPDHRTGRWSRPRFIAIVASK